MTNKTITILCVFLFLFYSGTRAQNPGGNWEKKHFNEDKSFLRSEENLSRMNNNSTLQKRFQERNLTSVSDDNTSHPRQVKKSTLSSLFTEDFSSGLGNWTIKGAGQSNWSLSQTAKAGGSVPEALINYSPSFNGVSQLVSPVINTSGQYSLQLQWKHRINNYVGDYSLKVQTTSDGINWHEVWSIFIPDGVYTITTSLEDLLINNSDVGSAKFQIAFTFDGNSDGLNDWSIDDVDLSAAPSIFSENFDKGIGQWTVIGAGASNWSSSDVSYGKGMAPEAQFYYSPGFKGNSKLVSDTIPTSGYKNLKLTWKQHIDNYAGQYTFKVETTNDGITWNTAWSQFIPDASVGKIDTIQSIIISNTDVGSDNFRLAFTFDGDSYNLTRWNIDDIVLAEAKGTDFAIEKISGVASTYGIRTQMTPSAALVNNSSQALTADVILTISDGATTVYTSTVTSPIVDAGKSAIVNFDSWTPAAGTYTITMSCSHPDDSNLNNNTQKFDFNVVNDYLFIDDFGKGLNAWNVVGGGSQNWKENANTPLAGGVAPEIFFNYSPTFNGTSRLVSSTINTSGYDALMFNWKHLLSHNGGGSYKLKVETTSDGLTWNTAWQDSLSKSFDAKEVTLFVHTSDVGSKTMQIAFTFDGENSLYLNNWVIDDVKISKAPDRDVAVTGTSIIHSKYGPGANIQPNVTVYNQGSEKASFNLEFSISSGGTNVFTSTSAVENLAIGETRTIELSPYLTKDLGSYNITIKSQFSGDENALNDSKSAIFEVTEYALVWEKLSEGSPQSFWNDIKKTNDGNLIAVGEFKSTAGIQVYIMKLDTTGTQIWARFIGENIDKSGRGIVEAEDGFYIIGSEESATDANIIVVKTDKMGNVLWEHSYGTTDNKEFGTDISLYNATSLIILGNQLGSGNLLKPYVAKIDENGNILWEKTADFVDDGIQNAIAVGNDGSIYIVGQDYNEANQYSPMTVAKLNNNGETLWYRKFFDESKTLNAAGKDILVKPNGEIVALGVFWWVWTDEGYSKIIVLDTAGTTLSDNIIDLGAGIKDLGKSLIRRGTRYFIGGESYAENKAFTFVEEVSNDFQIQWYYITDPNSYALGGLAYNKGLFSAGAMMGNNLLSARLTKISSPINDSYLLKIKVLGKQAQVLPNTMVTIDGITYTTNIIGETEFYLPTGTYSFTTVSDGFDDYHGSVTVTDDQQVIVTLLNTSINNNKVQIVRLYPNPAGNTVSIENASNSIVQFYDLTGNLAKTMRIDNTNKQMIDLSNLPNGLYMVRISSSDKVVTLPLSIAK